jgi:hypothetical protein
MTASALKTAGLLAMTSAFLTLPSAYLSVWLEGGSYPYADGLQTLVQAVGTLLFLAIILNLKRFLNHFSQFHDTDKTIALMIMASMSAGAVVIGMFTFPALKESLGSVVLAILVFQGIVQAQFGYKLLSLPDDLGGMLKPFCYANLATGICLASVILIPLGILASAISDLMLGTIFLNRAKRLQEQERRNDSGH